MGIPLGIGLGGAKALEKLCYAAARGFPFDIVIIDKRMPGIDGQQLAQAIKAVPGVSQAKIIFLTGAGDTLSEEQRCGLSLFSTVTKPVRPSDLFNSLVSVSDRAAMAQDASRSLASTPEEPQSAANGARVLIAEDHQVNQIVVSEILSHAGFACDLVSSGRQAIAAVQKTAYDVVLMDCQMPDIDGFAAARAIRQLDARRCCRIAPAAARCRSLP